eukprot:4131281-Amphidinium_carterae.1
MGAFSFPRRGMTPWDGLPLIPRWAATDPKLCNDNLAWAATDPKSWNDNLGWAATDPTLWNGNYEWAAIDLWNVFFARGFSGQNFEKGF